MEVYVGAIREVTPPDPSQTTINNPPDDAAIMKTTGHEIGHGIRIDHCPFGTGPRLTVMVSGFLSWINSSWTNIPTTYDGTDRAQIRIH
jgi:hypothetical protein